MSCNDFNCGCGQGMRAGAREEQRGVDARLVQGPRRKDGSEGRFYLRIRVGAAVALYKSARVDVPLETNERAEARARAAFVVRTLLRLGRRVMGDLAIFQNQGVPIFGKRRRRRKRGGGHCGDGAASDGQLSLF